MSAEPDGEVDDAELVARITAGEDAAFVIAYDRHSSLLFGAVVRFLGDRDAAGEIVQETYLALWRHAGQFDPRVGSLAGWLLGIARNRAIDRVRADSRRIRTVRSRLTGADPASDADRFDRLDQRAAGGSETDPAALVDRRWTQSVVRTAVSELPEAERRVLVLAYASGLSQSTIALQLGWPIGTVKTRTRRAMAHLRVRLLAVPGLVDLGEVAVGDRPAAPVSDR